MDGTGLHFAPFLQPRGATVGRAFTAAHCATGPLGPVRLSLDVEAFQLFLHHKGGVVGVRNSTLPRRSAKSLHLAHDSPHTRQNGQGGSSGGGGIPLSAPAGDSPSDAAPVPAFKRSFFNAEISPQKGSLQDSIPRNALADAASCRCSAI